MGSAGNVVQEVIDEGKELVEDLKGKTKYKSGQFIKKAKQGFKSPSAVLDWSGFADLFKDPIQGSIDIAKKPFEIEPVSSLLMEKSGNIIEEAISDVGNVGTELVDEITETAGGLIGSSGVPDVDMAGATTAAAEIINEFSEQGETEAERLARLLQFERDRARQRRRRRGGRRGTILTSLLGQVGGDDSEGRKTLLGV